jgi:methylglyoxal synthase
MDGIVSTSSGTTNQQVMENVGIQIYVESGDPTAGDGDLAVNIWYTIVDY